jgi:Flp pilus assembly protein TadB
MFASFIFNYECTQHALRVPVVLILTGIVGLGVTLVLETLGTSLGMAVTMGSFLLVGVVLPFIVWWACAKQMTSSMPSSSSTIEREKRAQIAMATAIKPDVSSYTKMATMAPTYAKDQPTGPP